MSEYKCIVCGEIRDSEKQCTCPSCGYMMFETPYDRSKILRSEISRFLTGLLNMEIDIDTLEFCRVDDKDEKVYISDDNNNRFPDADIITDYILSAEKTEEFMERMKRSAEEINEYMHNGFEEYYEADQDDIRFRYDRMHESLIDAVDFMSMRADILVPEPAQIKLHYIVRSSDDLLRLSDSILSSLETLHEKAYRFIKRNNVYGGLDGLSISSSKSSKL